MLSKVLAVPALAIGCAAVSLYSNSCLGVTEYVCAFPDLPRAFDGFRILHLSDLHNKRFGKNQRLLLRRLRAQKPDAIVFTGDIIHTAAAPDEIESRLRKVRPLLRGAAKIAPAYYATGNHEIESGHSAHIWNAVENCGVKTLINQSCRIKRGGSEVALIGAADPFFYGTRRAYGPLKKDLQQLCESERGHFRIVLSHRPELLDIYSDCGADLVLAGHSHGGQIRLPFTSQGLFSPDQGVLPKYTEGLHRRGRTTMVISRGLGNSGFPQRLFNRPEIVAVTLKQGGGRASVSGKFSGNRR